MFNPTRSAPGEPVENWLQRLSEADAVSLTAALDTADTLGPQDRRIVEGVRRYLTNLSRRASFPPHATPPPEDRHGGVVHSWVARLCQREWQK